MRHTWQRFERWRSPQEVVGDIGNAIWQLMEALKDSPPQFDTRWSTLSAGALIIS